MTSELQLSMYEWIPGELLSGKAQLVFRYEISDLFSLVYILKASESASAIHAVEHILCWISVQCVCM